MNSVKVLIIAVLLMLNGCSGAYVTVPVGPVTIGTDISMFGDSGRNGFDEIESDHSEHQGERE